MKPDKNRLLIDAELSLTIKSPRKITFYVLEQYINDAAFVSVLVKPVLSPSKLYFPLLIN